MFKAEMTYRKAMKYIKNENIIYLNLEEKDKISKL